MKTGFTLAEVLITLGVIGIVAAMTIPNLINNYQKHVIETNLKETYSILQQVMKFTEYDDVALEEFPDSPEGAKKWFTTYLQPHLKYSKICFHTQGCWQKKGKIKGLNGNTLPFDCAELGLGQNNITIALTNGSNINIVGLSTDSVKNIFKISQNGHIALIIDANGNSGPNIYGKDIFIALYHESKGIIPAGEHISLNEVRANCKNSASGIFCMSRVKNNGWEIPNDVWKIKI